MPDRRLPKRILESKRQHRHPSITIRKTQQAITEVAEDIAWVGMLPQQIEPMLPKTSELVVRLGGKDSKVYALQIRTNTSMSPKIARRAQQKVG